eukprot:TRINITY_DN23187_c1_g1_i1.p1 TRINITY_DN23187_c1_g1~~TRINITY_DN23187_c1_g1_i1.p1  ORF type:complete len:165 (-),score=21.75 TRINITY_DN23187_c1_g1_i1:207-701(-)
MARNQETRQFTSETDGLQAWTIVAIALVLVAFSILAWVLSVQTPDVKIVDFSQMTGSSLKEVKMDSSLGSNRDQRGCLQSAGFVWCEGAGRCIRPWQDSCPGGTEYCRSFCRTHAGYSPGKSKTKAKQGSIQAAPGSHSVYCRCKNDGKADDYLRKRSTTTPLI